MKFIKSDPQQYGSRQGNFNEKEYEDELRRIQDEHLKNVRINGRQSQPCLHDGCQECHGTGIKSNGSTCIHYLSCSCPKCSPCFL